MAFQCAFMTLPRKPVDIVCSLDFISCMRLRVRHSVDIHKCDFPSHIVFGWTNYHVASNEV